MDILQLQNDIAKRFQKRMPLASLGKEIASCQEGTCGQCGDACPIRAANWLAGHREAIAKLFTVAAAPVSCFHLRCFTWEQEADDLAKSSLNAVFKTTRRILDSLNDPALIAVGLLDARWGYQKWDVGITVFVGGSSRRKLRRAFDKTKNIVGPLTVERVSQVRREIGTLFRDGQHAKSAGLCKLTPERRGEYYAWLVKTKPSARVFRYGCDRYFNQLTKAARPVSPAKPPKPHPYPFWLERFRYGSHPMTCQCKICVNQR